MGANARRRHGPRHRQSTPPIAVIVTRSGQPVDLILQGRPSVATVGILLAATVAVLAMALLVWS